MVILNDVALRRMMISMLEIGWHPLTVFSLPQKWSLSPSWTVVSPSFFHRTSQSQRTFQRYLLISCVPSLNFPSVLMHVFQVPILIIGSGAQPFVFGLIWLKQNNGSQIYDIKQGSCHAMAVEFHTIPWTTRWGCGSNPAPKNPKKDRKTPGSHDVRVVQPR